MRAQNEAKIDTLRADNEAKIDTLRVENHKLMLDAKDARYDVLLIATGRDARELAAARAAGRARALSPAPRRASAFVEAAAAARASDSGD